jgi:SAM-dependent methyltransferase
MMSRMSGLPAFLTDLLVDGGALRAVDDRIWSVLPHDAPGQSYDGRAKAYDAVVGSRLYNRLVWGSSPRAYSAFAARALASGSGPFLDAGCGSLVFTAKVYARAARPVVLVDQSIGMLRAARARLLRATAVRPSSSGALDEIVLLQGDLRRLPFRAGSFDTVMCMGMLHLFDEAGTIVTALSNAARPGAQLFLTSLIAETGIGRRYLALLHRAGEVAAPRTRDQLLLELQSAAVLSSEIATEGSVAFIAARTRTASATGV